MGTRWSLQQRIGGLLQLFRNVEAVTADSRGALAVHQVVVYK
jgi:hypothetical protein